MYGLVRANKDTYADSNELLAEQVVRYVWNHAIRRDKNRQVTPGENTPLVIRNKINWKDKKTYIAPAPIGQASGKS